LLFHFGITLMWNFFHLAFHAFLPIEQSLGSETSPDGSFVAEYSWRPCGIIGLFTTDSPMLYLSVRDMRTGAVVSRRKFWGDLATLDEAKDRFDGTLPWQPAKESKWFLCWNSSWSEGSAS
jgi:hypothetical protein